MNNIFFTLSDGIFISLFSVLIVFTILGTISLIVYSLKYLHEKPKVNKEILEQSSKPFGLDDIKDEEMMIAALVAAIDYQDITKGDVKIKSVREIKTS